MLGFDGINAEGTKVSIINDGKPGFVDDLFMTEVEVGQAENGSTYICFKFKDDHGTVSQYEYEVAPDAENAENRIKSQMKRLKHVITKFVPEGTQLPSAETFPDMYNKLKGMLETTNYRNVRLRGKLVFNAKDWLSFPKYVPYLEDGSVDISDTSLSLKSVEDGGIDKLTKSAADNPAELASSNSDYSAPVVGKAPF